MNDKELLKFQFGPVQEFIAQARSTRDLWSGSYMLSWLGAHAIKAVVEEGNLSEADIVMPTLENNPLVLALRNKCVSIDEQKALTPNLPNYFLALVPKGKGVALAEVAEKAFRQELRNMGDAVWGWLKERGAKESWKNQWNYQIEAFPFITWAVAEWKDGQEWKKVYGDVGKALAIRRNTREFDQWNCCEYDSNVKDSLSGKEEVIGDDAFWKSLRNDATGLFNKAQNHRYGAINLIKRLWVHVYGEGGHYLSSELNFIRSKVWKELKVSSIPDIVKNNTDCKNPYIAVLAFDGDKMGDAISKHNSSAGELNKISSTLSTFALDKVHSIVATYKGHLCYAGGDDVLAILPASRAIDCAREIRNEFKDTTKNYSLDGSCGIAFGHKKAPLQMLVKEAQRMESVAKNKYNRAAVALALYKRSGEIIEWGTKWESGALDLMKEITNLTNEKKLSGRFPYALAALLMPYELKNKNDALLPVIKQEVRHVLSRQGNAMQENEREELAQKIDAYLDSTKEHLENFISLFLAETFINRLRGED